MTANPSDLILLKKYIKTGGTNAQRTTAKNIYKNGSILLVR